MERLFCWVVGIYAAFYLLEWTSRAMHAEDMRELELVRRRQEILGTPPPESRGDAVAVENKEG